LNALHRKILAHGADVTFLRPRTMIVHNPHDWIRPVLDIHRSAIFRQALLPMTVIGLLTAAVVFAETNWLMLPETHPLKNSTVVHTMLGFAISMLLVFRTNTAYDRWWEGRKLWGALVNTSRNLAIKLAAYLRPEDAESRALFAQLIALFSTELRDHLLRERTRLELDDAPHPELPPIDREKHVPAQVVAAITARVQRMFRQQVITGEQLIILNTDINAFLDICGACERIKNTPIPFSYSSFIKKFIVLYTITLPLGFAFSLGWYAVPAVMFIFYVLASLELIAEEIEDPFNGESNDVPMHRIAEAIERNVKEILA
jgi:putative membrane protein